MNKFFPLNASALRNRTVWLLAVLCWLGFGTGAWAQVSGTKSLPGDYATFVAFVTDINTNGIGAGGVVLNIATGYTETAPNANGFIITATGTLANQIIIQKSGVGTNPIFTAATGGTATPTSAIQNGILALVGSDYVTIDGIDFAENAANTTNPSTMEYGIALFKASATNGCQNNTIKNCAITMSRANNASGTTPSVEGSKGINVINALQTAQATVVTVTDALGTNSNNKFYTNTISDCNYGIVISGFAASTPFTFGDTGNDIGGTSLATGNTILNFGGAASASNPSAGIRVNNAWTTNISYNSIDNNNGSGVNHPSTLRGIFAQAGTSANVNITNNTVSVKGGGTTSAVTAIDNGIGSTAASNTVNITNNTVQNCAYSTGTTGTFVAINNSGTAATVNINNNTFQNSTYTGAATSAIVNGIVNSATAVVSINDNTINNITIASTGTCLAISVGSPTGAGCSANGNTITNITRTNVAGGIQRGIVMTSPTNNMTFNNNTINNISFTNVTSTGSIDGIYGNSSSTNITINGNIISNLSVPTTGSINGIREFGVAGTKIIQNNQVFNLTTTASGAGGGTYTGILLLTGTITVSGNKIHGLSSVGSLGTVIGLNISGGVGPQNVINNIIGDLNTPNATGTDAIRGIDLSTTATCNVYYNTIRLSATSSSITTFGNSCITFSTSPASLDLRNNILVNLSTPAQEGANTASNGQAVCLRRSSGTAAQVPLNYAVTSNNNIFWCNPTAGTNNHLTYAEGTATLTNAMNTYADMKAFMVNRDQLSAGENPTFVSTTGPDATFLHLDTAVPTFAESGAVNITGITTDFDGVTRQGNAGYAGTGSAPDIGADEFEGISTVPQCNGAPAASNVVASANTVCAGISTTLSLSVLYTELSYTYQWQVSPDNVAAYTNIVGATTASHMVTPTASGWYRCVITCPNPASNSTNATPIQINVTLPTYATLPYVQGFEIPWQTSSCVVAPLGEDAPDASWRNINTSGNANASWRADNTTTVLSGWGAINSYIYSPTGAPSGGRSARFHSGNTNAGLQGILDLYINLSAAGTKQLSFDYINTSGTDVLAVFLSTDGGITFNPVTTSPASLGVQASWTTYTASLASTSSTAIVRFRATADFGSTDIGLDNVTITAPCNSAPTAGTVSAPSGACSAANFNLSLTGASVGFGIAYQWESSPDGTAWTPISGATSSGYTANQTAVTYYRCVVTCTNTSQSVTTPSAQVNMNGFIDCYCTPPHAGVTSCIDNVTLGTINNATTGCVLPSYTVFPNTITTNLPQGSTVIGSVTTSISSIVSVWVDFNQNGQFEATEHFQPFTTGTTGALTINVPATATLGVTKMRVRSRNTGSTNGSGSACTTFGSGESEDYFVNVVTNPNCFGTPTAGTASAPTSVCASTNFNLDLTGFTVGLGITTQWQSSPNGTTGWANIVGATTSTYAVSQTAATFYRCNVTCTNSTQTVASNAVQVTMTPFANCYCAASAANPEDTDIGNVTFGALNNGDASTILSNSTATNTYTDFTALPAADFVQGSANTFSMTQITEGANFFQAYLNVFIDFNQNGIFDLPAERVLSTGNTTGANPTLTGNITIPLTAPLGNTRMRVVLLEGGSNTNPPCGTVPFSYGEVEDYLINVVAPPPCNGAPTAGTAAISASSVCYGASTTLSLTGFTALSSISFQWQSSTTSGSGFTNIVGATSPTYIVPSVTANTFYRCVVTCANPTPTPSNSNEVAVTVTGGIINTFPYIENFNSVTAGTLPSCWQTSVATGTNNWNTGTTANAGEITSNFDGNFVYKFYQNSEAIMTTPAFNLSSGGASPFALDVMVHRRSPADASDITTFYVNTIPSLTGATLLQAYPSILTGTSPATSNAPTVGTVGSNGWYNYQMNIPASFNAQPSVFFIIRGVTNGGGASYAIGFDNFRILPSCTGMPTAGTTVTNNSTVCLSGQTVNLSLSGTTEAAGIAYQWQSASTLGGTYTNIVGATGSTYTATVTATTFYRCVVTCTNSTLSANSTPVSAGITPAKTIPYANGFNSLPLDCWFINTNVTGFATVNWSDGAFTGTPVATPVEGTGMIYFQSAFTTAGNQARLFTPTITTVGVTGVNVEFKWSETDLLPTNDDNVQVQYATSPAGPWTNAGSPISRYNASAGAQSWAQKSVLLPAGAEGQAQLYVGLLFTSGAGNNIYLDDFKLVQVCTGIPTAGTVNAPTSVCKGNGFTLGLSGSTIASGITYQWQSSTTLGGTYTDIVGATNATSVVTDYNTALYYRCSITCTTSSQTVTTPAVLVGIIVPPYATMPVTESFENTWISGCGGTNDLPSVNWSTNPNSGNASWRRDDNGASANWTSLGNGTYTPSASNGNRSARFHSYDAPNGAKGILDLYVNLTSPFDKSLSFSRINTSGTDILAVSLSTDGGNTFTPITGLESLGTAGVWTATNATISANTGTGVIRFEATGDFGFTDIGIDNVQVAILCPTSVGGTASATATSSCPNDNITITATGAYAGPGATYQWQEDTGSGFVNLTNTSVYSNVTTNALTITGLTSAFNNRQYRCVVTVVCVTNNSANSTSYTITMNQAPSITIPPTAQVACEGSSATFSITATGTNLAYQWRKGGNNITGANSATYTITNTAIGDAGSYDCVISGTCSPNATSNSVALTINVKPVMTTSPTNTTICQETGTTLSVVATSFETAMYQWQVSTNGGTSFADVTNGANYSGATTATLSFINTPLSFNTYQYRCVVTNTCGGTNSSVATLTVTQKPVITVQPTSQSGCANQNYTFSVTATSDAGALTYQWQEDEGEGAGFVNLANDAVVSGVNTATLTLTNVPSIYDGDKYRCIVTNNCGSTNTDGLAMYSWVDTQAPVFAAYSNITFNASAGNTANCAQAVTFATPTATDNCANTPITITRTAGLASGANFPVGVTNMTYTATDAKNNVATLNFTITVVDDVLPVIANCPANITLNNVAGTNSAPVTYTAPTATDNCSGVTIARTTGLASGSNFPVGATTVTHEATDAAGNKVTCTFTVTVNFVNVAPTFTATNPETVLEDVNATLPNPRKVEILNWATGNDNDEAVQTLTYEVDQIQTTTLFNVSPAISSTGTLTYTLNENANGSSTFRVRVKDNGGVANGGVDVSAYQTFTINVTAVNDKPSIGTVTYNAEQVAGTDLVVEVAGLTAGGGTDEATQTFSITDLVAVTGTNVVTLPTLPIAITGGKAIFIIKLVGAGEAQIRLTAKDNGGVLNGGVDTDERVFTVKAISQEQVFVPTIFSPNNDNDNDFFRVKAAKGVVQTIKLEIFDAQNNLVFMSDQTDRVVDTGWDGKNQNGKQQPQGNYTWRLSGKYKDGRDIKATDGENSNINKGNVFLIRSTN